MHATGRQPWRARDGAPVHQERLNPEQTALYRLVQPHAASFIVQTEASTGSELPWFIKDEFNTFLECGADGANTEAGTPGRRRPLPSSSCATPRALEFLCSAGFWKA